MAFSARVTQLEGLLRRITEADACLVNYDGWTDRASSSATDEERRAMQAEADAARIDRDAASSELEALVTRLRSEEPGAVLSWANAHDERLAWFLVSDDAKSPYAESAAASADRARGEWGMVRAGQRAYSVEGLYAERWSATAPKKKTVDASITIITTTAEDPDQFENLSLEERRENSGGWKKFPLRSGRFVDTFLMKATDSDFSVFDSADEPRDPDGFAVHTCMISREDIPRVISDLEALLLQKPEETARALVELGQGRADLARVLDALQNGAWPESGDPAEEAAAFAFHLLFYARRAERDLNGVCWEYRGDVRV
jgi:hypothetical protein